MAVSKWLSIYNIRPLDGTQYYIKGPIGGSTIPFRGSWSDGSHGWRDCINNSDENLDTPAGLDVVPWWEFPWYREL